MRPSLPPAPVLVNTPDIELWPGGLLRARANAQARLLARADHVLRRKDDGRFLAAVVDGRLQPLVASLQREPGLGAARRALKAPRTGRLREDATLPATALRRRLDILGLDADAYARRTGLAVIREPVQLRHAGRDRWRRPLWLAAAAAGAWPRLQEAALRDGVVLEAISGYRSHAYQLGVFQRKKARGLAIDDILRVNAAPGFSEHHGGLALDIGTPRSPPADATFEDTPAFRWLARNAGKHGWQLSYPRDNPHGIIFEPWHWRFHPA